LCRALGHDVRLVSRPQRAQGTEVLVRVPAGESARVASVPALPLAASALSGRQVLVIDDDREIRQGMASLLEGWECEATCAATLAEAEGLLQRAPDAVVCDYRLPAGLTGLQALEALEARFGRRLPAVIVTGDTSPERVRELKSSQRMLLFKPVQPGKLRAALSALLAPAR
jgi:CheY-like chemotaxis protein